MPNDHMSAASHQRCWHQFRAASEDMWHGVLSATEKVPPLDSSRVPSTHVSIFIHEHVGSLQVSTGDMGSCTKLRPLSTLRRAQSRRVVKGEGILQIVSSTIVHGPSGILDATHHAEHLDQVGVLNRKSCSFVPFANQFSHWG